MPEKEPPKIKPVRKPEVSPHTSVKKGAEKQPEKPKAPPKPTSPEEIKARAALKALTNKKSELAIFADVKDVKTIEYVTSAIQSSQKEGIEDQEKILDDVMVKLKEGIDAGKIRPTPEVVNKLKRYALKHNRSDILPSMGGGAGPTVPQVYDETPGAEPLITDQDLIRKLREINFNLRTNSLYQNDIHRLNNDADSIGRLGLENKDISEDQIKEATERINSLIEKAQGAQIEARFGTRERELPVKEEDRKWIYLKDEAGNVILIEDETIAGLGGNTIVRNKQPLRDLLKRFETNAYARDEGTAYSMVKELESLPSQSNDLVPDDVRPYIAHIYEQVDSSRSLHWQPNNAEMDLIRDSWQDRQRIFYERIQDVLTSSLEQSREIMNLYSEAGVDAFIAAVRHTHPGKAGEDMANYYLHLKKSIYFNHDLELITRSSAGEVELLKKLAAMSSQTSFMREAVSDPIVQAMMASTEQALRKILRDNNGYLPPDLFTLRGGRSHWDESGMKLFKEKVLSGTIRDFKRNPDGSPVDKPSRIGYELGELFTEKDLEKQSLRLLAAQQQAKGIGMLNNRLLELFASAKAPGLETTDNTFSSIPYEGISRFFRPMGHLFGKYKFGDMSHQSIFATIVGARMPELVNFVNWSPTDYEHIAAAIHKGELSDWLKTKYGDKLGTQIYNEAKPFIEIVDEFFWTGRFGPHSAWGEIDATIGWTDLMREKEGGSIRIGRAEWWADRYLSARDPNWKNIKDTPGGREKAKKLARAYKAWTWAQMTLRSPEIVAENVFNTPSGIQKENKKAHDLRRMLIKEILGIDLETQVFTEATPNKTQLDFMNRIAVLDADVAAIQRKALYGGANDLPREIMDADYNILTGARTDETNAWSVSEAERRDQTKRYIESIKQRVLGNWQSIGDWERELGISFGRAPAMDRENNPKVDDAGNPLFMDDMLEIANFENIDAILARHGGKLTQALLDRPQYFYMGMDDVRIEDMDITNLGERAFSRLNNDLDARSKAITTMGNLLNEFRPKMDEQAVLKNLRELYVTEMSGRGPDSARAFVYYFGRLFGEYYRGHASQELPFLGRIIRRFGPPLSLAQRIYGKELGDVWSINNESQWIHKVAQIGALSPHEVEDSGKINKYSLQRLERELVASPNAARAEMIFLGYFIALGLVSAAAFTKSLEEETKH